MRIAKKVPSRSGEPETVERGGREEQPGLMNYSALLCTTPLSARGGMDAWMDGRMERRRANEGGRRLEGYFVQRAIETMRKKKEMSAH